VQDLSPLSKLLQLQSLYLNWTEVHDLSPLSKLLQLQSLYLWKTQVQDLSPLKKLKNLSELTVKNDVDRSPIQNLIDQGLRVKNEFDLDDF
jgi:Leucine-rich repeat (LRR) protein